MPDFRTKDLLTVKFIATPFALIFIGTNLYLLFYFSRMARFFLNTLSLIMCIRMWLFYTLMLILIVDLLLSINSDFLFCLISLIALKNGMSMQQIEMRSFRVTMEYCKLFLPFVIAIDISLILTYLANHSKRDRKERH